MSIPVLFGIYNHSLEEMKKDHSTLGWTIGTLGLYFIEYLGILNIRVNWIYFFTNKIFLECIKRGCLNLVIQICLAWWLQNHFSNLTTPSPVSKLSCIPYLALTDVKDICVLLINLVVHLSYIH